MALSEEEVANRYGAALFAFAQDNNCLESLHDESNALLTVVDENPDLIRVLSDPISNLTEKRALLIALTQVFSDQFNEFLKLLLEYNRFSSLIDILTSFQTHYNHFKNIIYGVAVSAVQLTQTQLKQLGNAYATKYGYAEVFLKNRITPEILGGVILEVGDRVVDGSVKTKLKKIRVQLISKE